MNFWFKKHESAIEWCLTDLGFSELKFFYMCQNCHELFPFDVSGPALAHPICDACEWVNGLSAAEIDHYGASLGEWGE
jgi:hypothetical protein